MKKMISILLALSVMICATSAMAEVGLSGGFATSPEAVSSMPSFNAGDVVSFDITGTAEGDNITFISYKYDSENEKIDNTTVQYINQYVAKGETQAVSYKARNLSEGVYLLKTKVGENDVYTAYYYLGAPSGTVAVTGVTLNKATLDLKVEGTETLTATVEPSTATNKAVTWESSNTAVATVADGVVTAVAEGTATITVTTVDGSKTATCEVTVTANQTAILYGDVNSSGAVDATDNIFLARYLGGWKGYETKVDLAASDVNDSGIVDATDNIILARHLGGWKGYDVLPKK